MGKPEILIENAAELGEGPVWEYRKNILYWIDIEGRKLHTYDYLTGTDKSVGTSDRIGMASLCYDENKLICAVGHSLYLYDVISETFTPYIQDIMTDVSLRFNDGKCDPSGRLYVGSMSMAGGKNGELYCVAQGGKIAVCERNIAVSNGIAFSNDGKYMYYNDTPSGWLWRYEYDKNSGEISGREAFIDYRNEKGGFDGMTIDSQGVLYIAVWGGFCVAKYDSLTGKKLDKIEFPCPNVSCCEFGGDDFGTLFITTAKDGGNGEYPLSGSVFAYDPGAKGNRCNKFNI